MSTVRHIGRSLLSTFGYRLVKDEERFSCPSLPVPTQEIVAKAAQYFSNSFSISPDSGLSQAEIKEKIASYFWHFPFEFDGVLVDADIDKGVGLRGRHYGRHGHIFPALLSMTDGSLAGYTVLDIACNAGFWSIQAQLAGADSVLGVEASAKNIEQANFILQLTGLDKIEYRVMNVYDLSKAVVGEFDITFCFGLMYHLDKPILALERLYDVTRKFAVVDTRLATWAGPMLDLTPDQPHDQNFGNGLGFYASKSAMYLMLQHVGFREVHWVQNSSTDPHQDYGTGNLGTFIAIK